MLSAIDRTINANIKRVRLEKGVTRARLASEVGVSAQQIYKYESMRDKIGAARLYLVAKALDTGLLEFYP